MKEALISLLEQSLSALEASGTLPQAPVTPQVDHTRDASHGDLATNLAMVLAKRAGMAPRALAEAIVSGIPENTLIARAEIAGPGFINFSSTRPARSRSSAKSWPLARPLASRAGAGRKVQVEFVSAIPPVPCMWAMVGELPLGTPCAACLPLPAGMCSGSSTTTMPDSRSITWRFQCRPGPGDWARTMKPGPRTVTAAPISSTSLPPTWPAPP